MAREPDDVFGDRGATDGRFGAMMAVALLVVALGGWWVWERVERRPAALAASQGRLTLAEEGGEQAVFEPRESPEIWYRVLLAEAPLGAPAHLVGEWIDPQGHVVRSVGYDTKPITHLPWETHVRFRLPADAPPGTWRVRLVAAGREVHSLPFEVGGGAKGVGP